MLASRRHPRACLSHVCSLMLAARRAHVIWPPPQASSDTGALAGEGQTPADAPRDEKKEALAASLKKLAEMSEKAKVAITKDSVGSVGIETTNCDSAGLGALKANVTSVGPQKGASASAFVEAENTAKAGDSTDIEAIKDSVYSVDINADVKGEAGTSASASVEAEHTAKAGDSTEIEATKDSFDRLDIKASAGVTHEGVASAAASVEAENSVKAGDSTEIEALKDSFDSLDIDARSDVMHETGASASTNIETEHTSKAGKKVKPCAHCGAITHRKCAGCKVTHYCSRACQRAAFAQHKKECAAIGEEEKIEAKARRAAARAELHNSKSEEG